MKITMVKDGMDVHYTMFIIQSDAMTRTFSCFCGIQHSKIVTGISADNIMLVLSNYKAKQHQDTS